MAYKLETYEIAWKSGKKENVEAHRVSHPDGPCGSEGGHIRFWRHDDPASMASTMVLSVNAGEVLFVRPVSTPVLPSPPIKSGAKTFLVRIEGRWFDRALELVNYYGYTSVEPAKVLSAEMGITNKHGLDGLVFKILSIAYLSRSLK